MGARVTLLLAALLALPGANPADSLLVVLNKAEHEAALMDLT